MVEIWVVRWGYWGVGFQARKNTGFKGQGKVENAVSHVKVYSLDDRHCLVDNHFIIGNADINEGQQYQGLGGKNRDEKHLDD